jgi:hypothetical protein
VDQAFVSARSTTTVCVQTFPVRSCRFLRLIHCPGKGGWSAFGRGTTTCFGLLSLSRLQGWRMGMYIGILRFVLHVVFVGSCDIELGRLVVKTDAHNCGAVISCLFHGL